MAQEHGRRKHNGTDRSCFKSSNNWTASAIPRQSHHSATLQDAYSYLLLFSPAPVPFSCLVLSWWFHLPIHWENRSHQNAHYPPWNWPASSINMYVLRPLLSQIIDRPRACVVPSSPPGPWIPFFLSYWRTDCSDLSLSWIISVTLPTGTFVLAHSYALMLPILKQSKNQNRDTLHNAHVLPWQGPISAPGCSEIPQKTCLHVLQPHGVLSQIAVSTVGALVFCCSLDLY